MSDNPTPAEMLREYRRDAPDFDNQQAEMFKALSANDRTELLFRMLLQTNAMTQWLHSRIDGAQPTQGMSALRSTTQ